MKYSLIRINTSGMNIVSRSSSHYSSFIKEEKMPVTPPAEEHVSFLVKFGLYFLSFIVGISARLAILHSKTGLTVKDIWINFALSAFTAVMIWFACDLYELPFSMRYVLGGFGAKYGDSVIIMIWRGAKYLINEEDKKKQ